jgi:uncharacterized protein YdaL
MKYKVRGLGAALLLAVAAGLSACGGGGGSAGTGASTGASNTGSSPPANAGDPSSAAGAAPAGVTLADVGNYPAKPTGSSGTGTGTGIGTGTGTGTIVYGPPTGPKTLVLYDAPKGSEWEKLGFSYAIMLRNLLGHFDAQVDLVPVDQYTQGQIDAHQATFYLGAAYDTQLPAAFLADAASTVKTLVWFKYNLWQLANEPTYHFTDTRGLKFIDLRGMNAESSDSNREPGFFNTVSYKGKDFIKYYAYNPATPKAPDADPDIGVVSVVDAAKATPLVAIRNPGTGESVPYVARAGNFWYVADMPFSYIGPRDRYLVLCDLLHDMMGIDHPESHKAMVRLEDVGALVKLSTMQRLSNFLSSKNVPFSVAVIPHHMDPFGVANGDGVPQNIPLSQATTLREALDYAKAHGGEIVMHGFTHQYGMMKNPWSGMSGDDYEFWDIVHSTPVAEDSTQWALNRLVSGLWELQQFNYGPVAWETPHYQASALASKAVPLAFNTTYQRVVYYTADKPDFSVRPGKDYMAGQIFPYVITRDYYGQRVLPENLGNIEYDIHQVDPSSSYKYSWQDIAENARYAKTVRDGFASFFFHPFWLEKDVNIPAGYPDFTALVQAITDMGFTWVAPSQVK